MVFGSTDCWSSKKQSTVAMSSTEAEYISLSSAITEGIWMQGLLHEMCLTNETEALVIYEDNMSCITVAKQPRKHQRMKHLDIKYMFIRDAISTQQVNLLYIPTEDQTADIFTKGLTVDPHEKYTLRMGIK